MPTQFIERMAIEVDGQGDAVLLLHGLGGSSNTWTPVMAALRRFRTVRPDLPGSARSHRVEGELTIARLVQAMQRVVAALDITRVHVVAHSLGTIVAQHLAVAEPALVRSLVLFGPLAAPPDGARAPIRARGEKARSEGVAGMQAIADALLQSSTSAQTKARHPSAAALVRESLMRQEPDGYARTCDALADAQAAELARITCPALLVTGDEDAVAPPQAVRALGEKLGRCRVEILRGCGHWTPVEKPDDCMVLLDEFYRQRL